jgi:chromosome segregation ATPase
MASPAALFDELEQRYTDMRAENVDLQNTNRKLKTQLDDMIASMSAVAGGSTAQSDGVTELKHARNQAEKRVAELEAELEPLRETAERIKKELETIANENAELSIKSRQDRLEAEAEQKRLTEKIDNVKSATKELQHKVEKAESDQDQARKDAEAARQKSEHLEKEAEPLKAELEKLKSAESVNADDSTRVKIENKVLHEKIEKIFQETHDLHRQLADAGKSGADGSDIERLRIENKILHEKIDELLDD